ARVFEVEDDRPAVEVVLPDVGVAVVDVDGPEVGEPAEVLLLPRSRREAAAAVSGPLERALEDVADHGIAVVPVVGTARGQRGAPTVPMAATHAIAARIECFFMRNPSLVESNSA